MFSHALLEHRCAMVKKNGIQTRYVVNDSSGTLEGRIYERAVREDSCARLASSESFSRGLRLERRVRKLLRRLDKRG
ncbi:hypothetical protein ACLOJK_029777 [Asimina triloba]